MLASIILLPAAAFAQTDDCDKDNSCIIIADTRSDIVVTATGADQPVETSGQAITEINRALIDQRQTQAIADLLATTPGVTSSRAGGLGQPTAVRIRGAEGDQTLVLIDGVRVNDPSSTGGGFDFGNLLSGNISRIEVLRGPNSVPWGSAAIGGVVNIVTTPPPYQLSGSLRGDYGSHNNGQLTGQIGDRFGKVAASLGGGYFHDDGISSFDGGSERDGFRQLAANGRVITDFTDDISLDLRGYYADSRVNYDGFQPAPPYAQSDTAEFSKTQQLFGYAGLNVTLLNGDLKNHLSFTISDINRSAYDPAFGTAPQYINNGRVERYQYQGDAHIVDAVRVIFGAEHEDSRFNDGLSTLSTRIDSGYIQAIISPSDTLTLTGGARLDHHKTYGTKATFSANAAWRPAYGTTIRASFGQGFKAPTLYQLFSFYGNAALKPETATSFDLGIEQSMLDGALKFGVTGFTRKSRDEIDFFSCYGVDVTAQPLCVGHDFDGYYDNIAEARAKGVEAFVTLRPGDAVTVSANYSYIDSERREGGGPYVRRLRRPVNIVNTSIDWDARTWLKVGGSLQLVSDSVDGFSNSVRLDGYALASVRASVAIGDHLELYGRVENLFDARYETAAGYGTERRGVHVGARARF